MKFEDFPELIAKLGDPTIDVLWCLKSQSIVFLWHDQWGESRRFNLPDGTPLSEAVAIGRGLKPGPYKKSEIEELQDTLFDSQNRAVRAATALRNYVNAELSSYPDRAIDGQEFLDWWHQKKQNAATMRDSAEITIKNIKNALVMLTSACRTLDLM